MRATRIALYLIVAILIIGFIIARIQSYTISSYNEPIQNLYDTYNYDIAEALENEQNIIIHRAEVTATIFYYLPFIPILVILYDVTRKNDVK